MVGSTTHTIDFPSCERVFASWSNRRETDGRIVESPRTSIIDKIQEITQPSQRKSLEGWWTFLSVIDVGKISCTSTGCRSNRKNLSNNLFEPNTRTEVFFSPAECTLI